MLPVEFYRGDEALKADRARILRRTWQFVGHVSMLQAKGDYIADVVGGAPVVVVRNDEGPDGLAAFHNVCRHRAGGLVADGTGNCGEQFVCRYHGWRYMLDGRLRSATDFGAPPGFDPRNFSLYPIRVESWRGMVFVNLDMTAAPLSEMMSPLDRRWAADLPQFGLTERRTHRIACNWKTYVENYLEGYHLPMVHPEFDEDVVVADYSVEIEGEIVFHAAPARDGSVNAGLWAWMWPNLAINTYRHGYMVERMTAVGPEATRLDYFYFFDPSKTAELADMFVVSDRVTAQDRDICEMVQRNLDAGVYRPGVLSPKHEAGIAWFQDKIAAGHDGPTPLAAVS